MFPAKCLDFFIPEAEEHLQIATQCLLGLESNPAAEEIHRLFRSVHTIKGSAAQVGLRRLGAVAHRLEDLIGQLRDGAMQPSAEIMDVCLQTLDALRKFLHRQWTSDDEMRSTVGPLLASMARWVPEDLLEDPGTGEDGSPLEASERMSPRLPRLRMRARGGAGKMGDAGPRRNPCGFPSRASTT